MLLAAPSLIPVAVNADFLDTRRVVGITRSRMSQLDVFSFHVMSSLRKACHVAHPNRQVWGSNSRYHSSTRTSLAITPSPSPPSLMTRTTVPQSYLSIKTAPVSIKSSISSLSPLFPLSSADPPESPNPHELVSSPPNTDNVKMLKKVKAMTGPRIAGVPRLPVPLIGRLLT